MSGSKGGKLQVNWERIRLQEAKAKANEAKELKELEKQLQRSEAQEERRNLLRERVDARMRREAEQAEAERQTYNRVRSKLEADLQRGDDLMNRHAGLKPPRKPDITDLSDSADSEAIRKATELLQLHADIYQRQLEQALVKFHQENEAFRATIGIQGWLAQFRSRAVRTARDVIVAPESNQLISALRQRDINLIAYADKAKRLIQDLGNDEDDLPDTILEQLDQVLNSTSDNAGNLAFAQFEESIEGELSRRKAEKQRIEEERLANEMLHRRDTIADMIADVLEDMGYRVSDIDEAVAAQDGCLYAWNKHWPEHVMRIDMAADGGGITSTPLRVITGQEQDTGANDALKRQEADVAFDTAWCQGENGSIRDFKQRLEDRAVNFSYKRQHRPGEKDVGTVPDTKLGKRIQALRKVTTKVAPPKARERKPT